jgi:hypothetical protein
MDCKKNNKTTRKAAQCPPRVAEIDKLLAIWSNAERMRGYLATLDKIPANRRQRQLIDSAQTAYGGWLYYHLGELLNEYGLGPEARKKEKVKRKNNQ